MRTFLCAVAAAALVSAQAPTTSAITPAPVVTNSPEGAAYQAVISAKEGKPLSATLNASTAPGGKGVKFSFSVTGLPELQYGPFMYHIHEKAVPDDGNCTATGAHLDPYKRGELTPCDASAKQTCQTGDLSGKYGNATAQTFTAEYIDEYSSLNPSDPSFFGKLSFVVHLNNKTRIGCANFKEISAGTPGTPYPTGTGAPLPSGVYNSTTPPQTPPTGTTGVPVPPSGTGAPPSEFTGAASQQIAGAGALLVAAAALML